MINDKDFSLTMEKFEEVATIAKKIIPGLRTKRTCFVFSGSRSICVETDDFWIGPSSKEKRFIRPEKRSLRRQIVKDVASGVGMIGLGAFVVSAKEIDRGILLTFKRLILVDCSAKIIE